MKLDSTFGSHLNLLNSFIKILNSYTLFCCCRIVLCLEKMLPGHNSTAPQSACQLTGRQLEQFWQFSELSLLQVSNLTLRAIAQCTRGGPVSVALSLSSGCCGGGWRLPALIIVRTRRARATRNYQLPTGHIPSELSLSGANILRCTESLLMVMGRSRFVTGYANDKIAGST